MRSALFIVAGLVLGGAALLLLLDRRVSRRRWAELALPGALALLGASWLLLPTSDSIAIAVLAVIAAVAALLAAIGVRSLSWEREILRERSRALLTDLTQNAEEASSRLRASERRVHDLVEVAPVGFFEADADGRLQSVSEKWRALSGLGDTATARGDDWLGRVHEDDRARIANAWDRAICEATPFQEEYRVVGPRGVAWILGQSTPRYAVDGTVVGHVGTLTDVTDRKEQEAERRALDARVRQSQKMESLATLAGGIAHDFNNLLVGILGNAEITGRRLPSESPIQRVVERIRTASLRAADLAGQMLEYAGRGDAVVEAVSLSSLVDEMGQLLEASLPPTVRLEYDLGRDLPVIEGDATQVRQVVMNLITNAAEAMEESGGVVRLATSLVQVDGSLRKRTLLHESLTRGPYVSLAVTDEGPGISPDLVERVFDPFFSTKVTGRGLGLAVVLGTVRAHGGGVVVDTAPGRGTTMTAFFPAQESMAQVGRPSLPRAPRSDDLDGWRGHGDVLVVDDETLVLIVAEVMLKDFGFGVHMAAGGAEGLALLRRLGRAVRVVVLDVTMPGMSGVDVLEEIRASGLETKVILTSGYPEREVRAELREARPDGFVKKPFRVPDLVGTVRSVLAESEASAAGE